LAHRDSFSNHKLHILAKYRDLKHLCKLRMSCDLILRFFNAAS